MKDAFNIVVVEDDAVISMMIRMHLEEAGHDVMEVFHSGELVAAYVKKHKPDLVLLDIQIEGKLDGIDVGAILKETTNTPFIYLTAFSDRATLERAKPTNPAAYVVKPYKPEDLYTAIEIGMFNFKNRSTVIDKNYLNSLISFELTEREVDMVLDIVKGLTNSQIASKRHVSLNTVKWHIQNIYSKFGVQNRASLSQFIHNP